MPCHRRNWVAQICCSGSTHAGHMSISVLLERVDSLLLSHASFWRGLSFVVFAADVGGRWKDECSSSSVPCSDTFRHPGAPLPPGARRVAGGERRRLLCSEPSPARRLA